MWKEPWEVCTSTLGRAEVEGMDLRLRRAGCGRVVNSWSDSVDYLVMSHVILTIKVTEKCL